MALCLGDTKHPKSVELHTVIEGERWRREKNQSTKLEKDKERGEK